MHWLYLALAILLEVAATAVLKLSGGLTRPALLAAALVLYGACFTILALAFRQIPVATAYAIWSGVGMVLITGIGALFFREPVSAAKLGFIGLILIGVVGLHLVEGR